MYTLLSFSLYCCLQLIACSLYRLLISIWYNYLAYIPPLRLFRLARKLHRFKQRCSMKLMIGLGFILISTLAAFLQHIPFPKDAEKTLHKVSNGTIRVG